MRPGLRRPLRRRPGGRPLHHQVRQRQHRQHPRQLQAAHQLHQVSAGQGQVHRGRKGPQGGDPGRPRHRVQQVQREAEGLRGEGGQVPAEEQEGGLRRAHRQVRPRRRAQEELPEVPGRAELRSFVSAIILFVVSGSCGE